MIDTHALLVFLLKKFGPVEVGMQEWRAAEVLHEDELIKITASDDMKTITFEIEDRNAE
jgi:hypothetical protein